MKEAHAATPRPGLAPLQADGSYPKRIRLLTVEERGLRTSKLEASNAGWEITLDALGYIKHAKRTFPPKSTLRQDFARWHQRGKMPARELRLIEHFIALSRLSSAVSGVPLFCDRLLRDE